jgi:hypothetical protein
VGRSSVQASVGPRCQLHAAVRRATSLSISEEDTLHGCVGGGELTRQPLELFFCGKTALEFNLRGGEIRFRPKEAGRSKCQQHF